MSKVLVTQEKLDELALHISDKSGEEMPLTIDEMTDAVSGIELPNLQDVYVTPSTVPQVIEPDSKHNGLGKVTVAQISPVRSWNDLYTTGEYHVYVPMGWYPETYSKAVDLGSQGTPTITKGAVSNNSVSLTPKVRNTSGYISGERTISGSPVTVYASELVSGSQTITDDGTYDITNLASVDVSVHANKMKLIASGSVAVNTTGTSAATATTIQCSDPSLLWTKDNLIYVRIRGRSGKRAGYFYGSDAIFCNPYPANESTTTFSSPAVEYIRVNSSGAYVTSSGSYGVYAYSISNSGDIVIRQRYNSSNTLTINDTFDIEVYAIQLPGNKKVFE